MNRMFDRLLLFLVVVLFFFSGRTYADSIGPNCGTCQGSVYSLTYDGVALPDSDPNHQTYQITLAINTSGYNGGGVAIDSVAIKVSSHVTEAGLVSAPGAISDWNLVAGGLNANGCDGSGSGFECVGWQSSGAGISVLGGPTLSWTFDITVNNGTLLTGLNQDSIKVEYVNPSDHKVGALVSEDITLGESGNGGGSPVPEPNSLLLLFSGLAMLAGFVALSKR